MDIGFVGLGAMGELIVPRLIAAGHRVTGWNRTREKANPLIEAGMRWAGTPREAAAASEMVFSIVTDSKAVRAVALGPDGVVAGLRKGGIFIDMSTIEPDASREVAAEFAKAGSIMLDGPLSGSPVTVKAGQASVMIGGDAAAFERARPVIAHYAQAVTRMGPPGAGQKTKMVNQICVAGVVQGLAEGLAFALRAGLDAKQVVDVISKGAASSWQMANRGHTMVDGRFDFGFAVDLMRKDLRIALEESRANGAELPATALIDQFYAKLQQQGHGRLDTSSLIKLVAGDR